MLFKLEFFFFLKGKQTAYLFFIKKEEDLQNRKENERKRKRKRKNRIYKRKSSLGIFPKDEAISLLRQSLRWWIIVTERCGVCHCRCTLDLAAEARSRGPLVLVRFPLSSF
jgi:uncharacterized Fe-S radical SAM superfamily protein PflX